MLLLFLLCILNQERIQSVPLKRGRTRPLQAPLKPNYQLFGQLNVYQATYLLGNSIRKQNFLFHLISYHPFDLKNPYWLTDLPLFLNNLNLI